MCTQPTPHRNSDVERNGDDAGALQIYKRFQAAVRVSSNVDRGPLARKRDVGFVYHHAHNRELQKQAEELGVEFPFRKST
jgi:hypothetical protein